MRGNRRGLEIETEMKPDVGNSKGGESEKDTAGLQYLGTLLICMMYRLRCNNRHCIEIDSFQTLTEKSPLENVVILSFYGSFPERSSVRQLFTILLTKTCIY